MDSLVVHLTSHEAEDLGRWTAIDLLVNGRYLKDLVADFERARNYEPAGGYDSISLDGLQSAQERLTGLPTRGRATARSCCSCARAAERKAVGRSSVGCRWAQPSSNGLAFASHIDQIVTTRSFSSRSIASSTARPWAKRSARAESRNPTGGTDTQSLRRRLCQSHGGSSPFGAGHAVRPLTTLPPPTIRRGTGSTDAEDPAANRPAPRAPSGWSSSRIASHGGRH